MSMVVVGPPGSGKTTYCAGMQQLLRAVQRKNVVVNLDPLSEILPYKCGIDIKELITGYDTMKSYKLGPNGSLIFCMEYLLENIDWLYEKLDAYKGHYVIFDCPGQVELFTHHDTLRKIIKNLDRRDFRLTCVHLVDSTLCADGLKYISSLLLSLNAQLQLELPHINILSKLDLLKNFKDSLHFKIDYYAGATDLDQLLTAMDGVGHPMHEKLRDFSAQICELVEDYNLIGFHVLDVQDKENILAILKEVDKANGYSLGDYAADAGFTGLALADARDQQEVLDDIQERYIEDD